MMYLDLLSWVVVFVIFEGLCAFCIYKLIRMME
jgi:hypothetical protein